MNFSSVLTLGDFCRTGQCDFSNPERRVKYVSVTRLRDNVLEGREISILLFLEGEVGAQFAFHFPEGTVLVVKESPC
jgi:hypothetical protein